MPTRRKFLIDCSSLVALSLACRAGVTADKPTPAGCKKSFDEISYSDLAQFVNTTFQIQGDSSHVIQVTLAEMRTHPRRPLKAGQHPVADALNEKFSIFFTGLRDEMLQQDTRTVSHPMLGLFDLFLTPVMTRNPALIDYEAVVNRPTSRNRQISNTKG